MNVTLSSEMEKLIQRQIEVGHYASPDAVVEAALHLLNSQGDAEAYLEQLLAEAEDETEEIEATPELREEILREGLEELKRRRTA